MSTLGAEFKKRKKHKGLSYEEEQRVMDICLVFLSVLPFFLRLPNVLRILQMAELERTLFGNPALKHDEIAYIDYKSEGVALLVGPAVIFLLSC